MLVHANSACPCTHESKNCAYHPTFKGMLGLFVPRMMTLLMHGCGKGSMHKDLSGHTGPSLGGPCMGSGRKKPSSLSSCQCGEWVRGCLERELSASCSQWVCPRQATFFMPKAFTNVCTHDTRSNGRLDQRGSRQTCLKQGGARMRLCGPRGICAGPQLSSYDAWCRGRESPFNNNHG